MKKENLKRIIQDLDSLLTELKSEVYSDQESFIHPWYEQTGMRLSTSLAMMMMDMPIEKS